MSLFKQIEQDIIQAMKAGHKDVVSTLRMAKSAANNVLIDKNKKELTDAETIDVLQKQLKKNAESLEMYIKGNRQELALAAGRGGGGAQGHPGRSARRQPGAAPLNGSRRSGPRRRRAPGPARGSGG